MHGVYRVHDVQEHRAHDFPDGTTVVAYLRLRTRGGNIGHRRIELRTDLEHQRAHSFRNLSTRDHVSDLMLCSLTNNRRTRLFPFALRLSPSNRDALRAINTRQGLAPAHIGVRPLRS